MASRNCQGRRLDWSICQSDQVADLTDPWAKLLFTWLIPNADNCGRIEGEPYQIAGLIFPLEMKKGTVTVAKVEKWLRQLDDLALIIWYQVGRLRYIQLPKFSDRQTLSGNMKATSDYPAPDESYIQGWRLKEEAVLTAYGQCTDAVRTEDKDKDKDSYTSDARTVFVYWQDRLGHPGAKFSDERKAKIVARLKDGLTVEKLCAAIDGCAASPYHMGENDSGTVYDSIDLIFRNVSKVEEFAAKVGRRPGEKPPDPRARSERIRRAAEQLAADPHVARAMVNDADEWQEAQQMAKGAA